MKKLLTVLFLAIAVNGNGQGILDGFKILQIPRETIPLGAEWIDGVGVNGSGVPETNININRSIQSLEIDNTFNQNLNLSILNYFNLDASYIPNITITYKNLTIYTVKDISEVKTGTGKLIIYECIKADSIFFKINKELKADLKIKLDEKIKNLQITGKTDFNKGVSFSGNKLFLAFRVFELGKTKVNSKTSKIKDTRNGGGLKEVTLLNTRITFNDYGLKTCVDANQIPINQSKFSNCSATTPIDVDIFNYNKTDITGQPFHKRDYVYNNHYKSLSISERTNNILTTDVVEITYMIKNSIPMLFFQMDNASKVVIKRMETTLKMFKNPKAPGW